MTVFPVTMGFRPLPPRPSSLGHLFSLFLLALLVFLFLTPLLDQTLGDLVILPLAACFLLSRWNAFCRIPKRDFLTLGFVAAYIAMILFYRYLGLSNASLSAYAAIVKFYLCFAFMIPVAGNLGKKELKFLLAVAIVSSILTMLYNFHLQQVYGARYSMRAFRAEGIKGITYTQYLSAIMLVSGAFLAAALRASKLSARILFLGLFAFFAYYNLAVGQRGIVFFLSIFLYGLIFLFSKPVTKKRLILFCALACCTIFLIANYESVFRWMAASVSSSRLKNRIETVLFMLQAQEGDAETGSFAVRLQLVGTSLKTFVSSPANFLFGAGDRRLDNWTIGNHSHFADELARYGLVGGAFSIWLLFRLLGYVRSFSRVKPQSTLDMQLSAIFLVLLLRCVIGSVVEMAGGIHLFITIPLLFRWLQEENADTAPATPALAGTAPEKPVAALPSPPDATGAAARTPPPDAPALPVAPAPRKRAAAPRKAVPAALAPAPLQPPPLRARPSFAHLFSVSLLALLAFVVLTPLLAPPLGGIVGFSIAACCLIVQGTAFSRVPKRDFATLSLAAGSIALILVYRFLGISGASFQDAFAISGFCLCFALMLPVAGKLRQNDIKFLLAVTVGSAVLGMFCSCAMEGIQGLATLPGGASLPIVAGAFLAAALRPAGPKAKILSWGLAAFFAWCAFAADRNEIASFLCILLCALVFPFSWRLSKKRLLLFGLLAACAVFPIANRENPIRRMASSIASPGPENRIGTALSVLREHCGGLAPAAIAHRLRLVRTAFGTAVSSPSNFYFGAVDLFLGGPASGPDGLFAAALARHALMAGTFCIWALVLVRMLGSVRDFARVRTGTPLSMQLCAVFLVLLLVCAAGNVVGMADGVHLFITVPLLFRWVQEKECERKRGLP